MDYQSRPNKQTAANASVVRLKHWLLLCIGLILLLSSALTFTIIKLSQVPQCISREEWARRDFAADEAVIYVPACVPDV